jgi:2,3-bisphosphoglycerate-dependent phosphoglycerate mutase
MPARPGPLDLLLVRHAEAVAPDEDGVDETSRPLTATGARAAEELADELEPYNLAAIYSSPYRRARDTVEPLAARRGLQVQELPDLRERLLSPDGTPEWRHHLERSWADADYALAGGESGRAAQLRAMAVLDLVRLRHLRGGRVVVASHGNLISLVLQALEPAVDLDFHLAMPMPAIYHLEHDGVGWRVRGGHGFAVTAEGN